MQYTILTKLQTIFPLELQRAVADLLEARCGSQLPSIQAQGPAGIERVQCAVVKLSDGSFDRLVAFVEQANIDWRDVLVAAGFANENTAHLDWLKGE